MRSVTVYKTGRNGETVKLPASSNPTRESYESTVATPQSQRILDAYYALECQGKLKGNFHVSASYTRDVHRRALERARV